VVFVFTRSAKRSFLYPEVIVRRDAVDEHVAFSL
jgi:hypothetical protein